MQIHTFSDVRGPYSFTIASRRRSPAGIGQHAGGGQVATAPPGGQESGELLIHADVLSWRWRAVPASVGYLPRLPHLQLDDRPELTPRRMPDHPQHALDDNRLRDVEALVRLAGVEPGWTRSGCSSASQTARAVAASIGWGMVSAGSRANNKDTSPLMRSPDRVHQAMSPRRGALPVRPRLGLKKGPLTTRSLVQRMASVRLRHGHPVAIPLIGGGARGGSLPITPSLAQPPVPDAGTVAPGGCSPDPAGTRKRRPKPHSPR